MTSEVLSQAVGAGATITFGQGRIFNLLQAASPVTIVLETKNSSKPGQTRIRKFVNIPAGSKFTAKENEEWTFLKLTSAAAQNVTLFVGDDDMTFSNAVTVTGVAVVSVTPATTINSPVASILAGNTLDATGVPVNLARKWVTVYNLQASLGPIRVSDSGATGRGEEVAPGTSKQWNNTSALAVRCDTANGATWGYSEET